MRKKPQPAAPVKKKRSLPSLLLRVTLAGVIVLLLLVTTLTALVFSSPMELPPLLLTGRDIDLQQELTRRLFSELSRSVPPEESELTLTPAEVDSLMRIADALFPLTGRSDVLPPRYYRVKLEDGRFHATAPLRTGWSWLWGGELALHFEVIPEKDGDLLDADVRRFNAGKVPLPSSIAARAFRDAAAEFREREEYPLFNTIVKNFYIDDNGNFRLTYRPRELKKLLREHPNPLLPIY